MFDPRPLGLYREINNARPRTRNSCISYTIENIDYLTIVKRIGYWKNIKIKTPYGHNTDIQSLRAGFCGGGVILQHWQKTVELGSRTW